MTVRSKALALGLALALVLATTASARSLQQFDNAPTNETEADSIASPEAVPEAMPEAMPTPVAEEANATETMPAATANETAEETMPASTAAAAAAPAEYNQGKDECIYSNHPKTLVEIAAGSPDFSVLVAALNASDLTGAFDDISQKVTVFAPTDAAFTKLFDEFNVTAEAVLGNKKFLTDVLTYHVAPGVYPFGTLAQDDGAAITTLQGESLGVSAATGTSIATVYSFGFPVGTTATETVAVTMLGGATNATIVQGNVWACQGVIQVIDTVLVPQSAVTSDQ